MYIFILGQNVKHFSYHETVLINWKNAGVGDRQQGSGLE